MSFINKSELNKVFKEFDELVNVGEFPEQYFQELFDELKEDIDLINNLQSYIVSKKYMPESRETKGFRVKVLFALNKDMN